MTPSLLRRLSALVPLLCCMLVPSAQAQTPDPDRSADVLRALDHDAFTYVAPPPVVAAKVGSTTADIVVSYSGFSAQARDAFEFAVSLWEQFLTSPVTIHVDASFVEMEEGVLGSAGPRLTANFTASALSDTWYPTSLADAITGQNLHSGSSDIVASFNSSFENWYFGTDGRTPRGRYDFVTVVLHELGHGLGFTGSFDVEDDDDEETECGTSTVGAGCWGLTTSTGRQLYPMIFDRFVQDAAETALLNTAVYPNPSHALGVVLQSGNVFFDGLSVRSVHEDVPVDLYAPENFERGSSFSHLDERAFPPGDPNSLMTPFLAGAEAIHSPGPVTCALFKDLGWAMGEGCLALFFGGLASAEATLDGNGVLITFDVIPGARIDSVIVEVSRFGEEPTRHGAVDVEEGALAIQHFEVRLDDLEPGRYQIRLVIVDSEGGFAVGPDFTIIVPLTVAYALSEPYPNPAGPSSLGTCPGVCMNLMVRDQQSVRADVYDALGRRQARVLHVIMNRNESVRLVVDIDGLPSGTYFLFVRGDEFIANRSFVIVR